ncbi:MAG TPA: hypothetical protein PL020_01005 [Candidatus Cloacimonadota bacterium]|nr:hypothetical protein [Candidatus Cloacimonadota bacterium]
MKRTYLFLLLLIPALLLAQGLQQSIPGDPIPEDEYEEAEGSSYGLTGRVGTVTHNGLSYSQVRLMPEFNLGKFGFGLDIDFLIDAQGKIYKENWDDWEDYLNKIFYIRYGGRRDPYYFMAGCIPDYTLGHGLIFDHYSNMLRYPSSKNVGAYAGVNTPISGLGFEAFTHNIHKNQILAARAHINPLDYTGIPMLQNVKIGLNIGLDRNQYGKYEDEDDDNVPDIYDRFPNDKDVWLDSDQDGLADDQDFDLDGDGAIDHPDLNPWVASNFSNPDIIDVYPDFPFDADVFPDVATMYPKASELTIYSLDYILPLVANDLFYLDHYGEYAKIDKHGSGIIFPGFSSKFFIFDAKFEFRNFADNFIPGYFDRLYDEQRTQVRIVQDSLNTVYSLYTKEDLIDQSKAALGWFGYLKANIANFGYVKVAYQDMYGEGMTTGKSLWANVTANPKAIEKLKEASIYYSQTHARYIDFIHPRTNSAALSGRVVYGVSETTDMIARYSETYSDINGDGKIKGEDEIISSFAIGVEFRF